MDVLDALEATAHLAEQSAATADGLLIDLAKAPGVDAESIRIRPIPRARLKGLHAVTWTQEGRSHTTEGHTLDVALRRAVRRSGAVSAHGGAR